MPTHLRCLSLLAVVFALSCSTGAAEDKKAAKPKKKPKVVAGKADVMRHVRKKFASFKAWDAGKSEVRLAVDGEESESTWRVLEDAEIKVDGWWGRLEQFDASERVWVWFAVDRDKKPQAILMVADIASERDIHGKTPEDKAEPLEERRRVQQDWLRERWRGEGLPGAVSFVHPIGGEVDVILDHEAIRWGRYLKNGDEVTIATGRPIAAKVKAVQPWRERTQMRLASKSALDLLDLEPGQRIHLKVAEPPAAVQASDLPPDIGRLADKEARIDWFLSTIYCSCAIAGDRCTGMFYTQASCNVNACGMPNDISRLIGGLIDEGKSDEEIFLKYKGERGDEWWRPHLLK